MKRTVSIQSSSRPTDILREKENHMYIPPDILATWLNTEISKSKRTIQSNKVLQSELNNLKDTKKTYNKQGDVYFLQPKSKVSALASDRLNTNTERNELLQAELDALMHEFSNLSNFELSKPE